MKDGPTPSYINVSDLQRKTQVGDVSIWKQNSCPQSTNCSAALIGYLLSGNGNKMMLLMQI